MWVRVGVRPKGMPLALTAETQRKLSCAKIVMSFFAKTLRLGVFAVKKLPLKSLSVAVCLFDKILRKHCLELIHAHGNTLFKAHLYDLLQLFFCGVYKLKINTGAFGGFCERASSF